MSTNLAVKSATRVFDILEFFRETQRPLRLSEIAERFGYPPSSVSGLLKTMTAQGYLSFDANRRSYFPTARLLQLVSWIPNFEEGVVMQAMKNLQKATGEMIVLGTIQDIYVEYVEVLRSSQEIQAWSPPGTKRLLVANGMGLLLLSRLAGNTDITRNNQILRIYRRASAMGFFKEADYPIEALAERVNTVRGQGYVFTRSRGEGDIFVRRTEEVQIGPINPGGSMISMLVPCPPNHRPLALGIAGPAERLSRNLEQMVQKLRQEIDKLALVEV
ncbi:MAG TPA: helix-turn-helix domain-containing protein [Stellaceae bacterium]|jgi:DNA-binding IclR family transcriptional regulator|nr:helix-turn-helix domain-containing protein [Stellaceae bacterium]